MLKFIFVALNAIILIYIMMLIIVVLAFAVYHLSWNVLDHEEDEIYQWLLWILRVLCMPLIYPWKWYQRQRAKRIPNENQ